MSSNESEESGGLQSDSSADSACSEQENDSVIMEENSCDEHEVEERQMTSQDSTNPSSQEAQSQPSMTSEKEASSGVVFNFDLQLNNSSY